MTGSLLSLVSLVFFLLVPCGTSVATESCSVVPGRDPSVTCSARDFFAELPITIFESTPEGLSEEGRRELLDRGYTRDWEISGEDKDIIVFASLPFHDSNVALRLFRNVSDGWVLGVIGTIGTPICVLEAWKRDKNGRVLLADLPDEPSIREFLSPASRAQLKNLNTAVMFCLGLGGLQAKPLFWGKNGMVHITQDYAIRFIWEGRDFKKYIEPAATASETGNPSAPAQQPALGSGRTIQPPQATPDRKTSQDTKPKIPARSTSN